MSERIYDIEGNKYPSVTTILGMLNKPALMPWAVKMTVEAMEGLLVDNHYDPVACQFSFKDTDLPPMLAEAKKAYRKKSTDAMSIGTQVHEAIENWIESGGKLDPEEIADPQIRQGLQGFLNWGEQHDIHILQHEQVVFSHEFKYAGRYDLLATIDGKRTLVDFKTSSGIWDEYWYQLAAYAVCLENQPEVIAVLRIDKETGEIEYEDRIDWFKHAAVFHLLAKAYNLMKELK